MGVTRSPPGVGAADHELWRLEADRGGRMDLGRNLVLLCPISKKNKTDILVLGFTTLKAFFLYLLTKIKYEGWALMLHTGLLAEFDRKYGHSLFRFSILLLYIKND